MESLSGAGWRGELSFVARTPSQQVYSFNSWLTLGLTPVTSFWFVLALLRQELGSEFGSPTPSPRKQFAKLLGSASIRN